MDNINGIIYPNVTLHIHPNTDNIIAKLGNKNESN